MTSQPLALRRAEDLGGLWSELCATSSLGATGGPDALLDHLDADGRRARRAYGALGLGVRRALTWEPEDRRTPRWWPQGVTDAHDPEGRELLLTTWYARTIGEERNQGSRLSVVDPVAGRYEHVLLVEPRQGEDGPTWRPLKIHAGGVVWWGSWVHVAATRQGFATCHLDDLRPVPQERRAEFLDHRWVLPMRLAHRAETGQGAEPLRYSFLSLDLAEDAAPHLVVGEYGRGRQTVRLTRWPLDPETRLPALAEDGRCRPADVRDGVPGMQGAVVHEGRWLVSTSHGPRAPGSLWVGSEDGWRRRRWATPMGPEDLSHTGGSLWTVTEHPRRRWIVELRVPGPNA